AQHDAEAEVDDPDAGGVGRGGGGFPLSAHRGQESLAGPALLGQHLVTAVPVVADRRRAGEDLRRAGEPREGAGEQSRALHTALADARLLRLGPGPARDVFAGEGHDGIEAPERAVVQDAGRRVPPDPGAAWRPGPARAAP